MKVIPQDQRDFRPERYNGNRPKRDFAGHAEPATAQVVNIVFREPIHPNSREDKEQVILQVAK